jgi:hypothetical protein
LKLTRDLRYYLRSALPVTFCVMAGMLVVWLQKQSPGLGAIHGIGEAREYTISVVEAGRLAEVFASVGQEVSHGQVFIRLDPEGKPSPGEAFAVSFHSAEPQSQTQVIP